MTGFFQQAQQFCFPTRVPFQRLFVVVIHQLPSDTRIADGAQPAREVVHFIEKNEGALSGFVWVVKERAVGCTVRGRLPNRCCVAVVGGVELDDAPPHVRRNRTNDGCFAHTWRSDQKHAGPLWSAGPPFLEPLTELASLRIVALELAFGRRTMPLRPIADGHNALSVTTVYQPAVISEQRDVEPRHQRTSAFVLPCPDRAR